MLLSMDPTLIKYPANISNQMIVFDCILFMFAQNIKNSKNNLSGLTEKLKRRGYVLFSDEFQSMSLLYFCCNVSFERVRPVYLKPQF